MLKTKRTICAIGGGKGGVGKSVTAANIGVALAKCGKNVVLVDTDLGGANLHTLFGIKKNRYNIYDFISKKVPSLKETQQETGIENLALIGGASDILALANMKFAQKEKLVKGLKKLDTDFILLDLGAGSSYHMLDFFLLADLKILVFSPEHTSIMVPNN